MKPILAVFYSYVLLTATVTVLYVKGGIAMDALQLQTPRDIVRLAVTSPAANRETIRKALCVFGEATCEQPKLDGDLTVIECTILLPMGATLEFVTAIRTIQGVTNVEILGSDPAEG